MKGNFLGFNAGAGSVRLLLAQINQPEANENCSVHGDHRFCVQSTQAPAESPLIDGSDLAQQGGGFRLQSGLAGRNGDLRRIEVLVKTRADRGNDDYLAVAVSDVVLDDER